MKNYFLIISFFVFNILHAQEIRLYQEKDHTILCNMIANNEELLVPGNDFDTRIAETVKFLGSNNYTTQVYIKNDELVGFITYTKEGYVAPFIDMKNYDSKKPTSILHGAIQLLAVQEKYYRQGIGKALVKVALEDMKCKKVEAVILQTKVKNSAARSLYEKFGFELMFPVAPTVSDCFYRLLFLGNSQ